MSASLPDEQKIAETLVHSGTITIEQLKKAVEFRDSLGGGAIRDLVVKLGYAKAADVDQAIAAKEQAGSVNITLGMIDHPTMKSVPYKVFEVHQVVPLRSESGRLKLAMTDPNNLSAIEEIQIPDRSLCRSCCGSERGHSQSSQSLREAKLRLSKRREPQRNICPLRYEKFAH